MARKSLVDFDLNANKVTNLGTPVVATDAATMGYVDSRIGLSTSLFEYKASTSGGVPGINQLLWNNATQISATTINVNTTTNGSFDIDLLLGRLSGNDNFYIQEKNASANFQKWVVTGTPSRVVSGTPYWSIPATLVSSGGTGTTNFPNNTIIVLMLFSDSGSTNLEILFWMSV